MLMRMSKKLGSILMCIIIFNQLAYAESFAPYYVTAIVSDMQGSRPIISKEFDYHVKYDNISITTRFVQLPRASGLSQIISTVENAASKSQPVKDGEEIIYLSQIMARRKNIMKEVYWNRALKSNEITKCSQIFQESMATYNSCGRYKVIYADAINILIYRTFVQPVMIVVDQDPCTHQLASMLKNSTYAGAGNYQEPLFHYVNDSFNLLSDLSEMLYKATIHSATTIILLCSDSLTDLIFRLAKSSAISYSNILWVAIEYMSSINNSLAPPSLLSISLNLAEGDALAELNKSAINLLVVKTIASLAVNEKVVTKLSIKLVKQSLAASSNPSCTIEHANFPIAFVSLRQSQHTWMTLYNVNNDGSVSQLVDDKKVSWLSRLKTHKAKIMVTTMPEKPFVSTVKQYYSAYTRKCSQGIKCRVPKQSSNGTVWEVSCCVGYIMELLKRLQEDLWLAIDLHVAEDGLFGSIVNGTWNGMIGELVAGKADIAISALTSTSKRSSVVDFGNAFLHVSLGILVSSDYADEVKLCNFNFVANVTCDLLLALLGMFICGLIVLYSTENFLNRLKGLERSYVFRESFSYLSGLTFQRDLGGANPNRGAPRVMFIVFAFGMVIVMTTYTATLTAVQVKRDNNALLTGMNDPKLMNPSESFKFATLKSSSVQEYFRFSDNVGYQRLNAFMDKYNTDTNAIGAQKVLSGELQALIGEYPILQYLVSQQKDCHLRVIKTNRGKATWNVAFQKNSHWKDMMSKKILEYKEKGQLDNIMIKWIKSKCITQKTVNPTSQKYRIAHFSGLIALLACTLIFSMIILLGESWISKEIKKSSNYKLKNKELT